VLDDSPVIAKLLEIEPVKNLIMGILPGLALRLFVVLLPVLLYPLNRAGGAISKADVDFQVSTQYFVFQVLTVFAASFVSGTLFDQVKVLAKEPQRLLLLLGTGAPRQASFFIICELCRWLQTPTARLLAMRPSSFPGSMSRTPSSALTLVLLLP
jgi:hypothetical protein